MDVISTQGIRLPKLGFGTFKLEGSACSAAVESAIELGYRHIDTAERYANEEAVGAGIAASGLKRSDLHVTTKVWHDHLAPDAIRRAFDASLARLKLDYVDLYLVHWPTSDMDLHAIFETLLKLREEGRTRAIGVANFTVPLLKRVVEEVGAPIACNQIEYHVFLDQTPVRSYLSPRGIPVTAYCPLAQGRVAESAELAAIADKHGATPAQVALKWLLDQGDVAVIPKASGPRRQLENMGALKLVLDDVDRAVIADLPKNARFCVPDFAPLWDPPAA